MPTGAGAGYVLQSDADGDASWLQQIVAYYLKGGNSTTKLGAIPFQSNTDQTSLLLPNVTTTRKYLSEKGDGTNGLNPSWEVPIIGEQSKLIWQASHSFSVGDVLYLNGTTYTKAKADAAATSEVVGMVSAVAGVNDFTITTGGYVIGLSGLTAGSVYFLSPTTAGALTATEPTTEGHISKPLLVADSTTSGYLFNMRGFEVTATSISHYRSFVNADLSTGVLTVTHGLGHKYCSVTVVDNNEKIILPDEVTYVDNDSLTVTLTTYGAITGTWRVVVLDVGATLATPVPVASGGTGLSTFDEQRLMGRITGGQVAALTAEQSLTLLGIGQAWTTPAFDAGNFTASGSMTWTVEAGDVKAYAYTYIGPHTMVIMFSLEATAVGGTPSSALYIQIPDSKVATKSVLNVTILQNPTIIESGYSYIGVGDTKITLGRLGTSTPWTVAAANIYGQITIEVN